MIKMLVLQVALDVVYIVCVTKAAMYFNNTKILFWYLFLLIISYLVKPGEGKK